MYFKNFPGMFYRFDIGGKEQSIFLTDITQNIRFRRDILANLTIYDEYDIVDSETPEHIAEKFYKNPNYHWIIMLTNERYDYLNDFPLSTHMLEQYVTNKYGSGNEYNTHHWELNGYVVDSGTAGASSVSNYDYEATVNESKRRIKIIPFYLVEKILKDFADLI